jgi:hypothetical protein
VPVGGGRELCLEVAGDPHGKPILVQPGEPMSRRLYGGWIADAENKGIRLIGIDRPGGDDRDASGKSLGRLPIISDHFFVFISVLTIFAPELSEFCGQN